MSKLLLLLAVIELVATSVMARLIIIQWLIELLR